MRSNEPITPDEPVWDKQLLIAPHRAADKARRVRAMFEAIAPSYERVNTIFSGGRDAVWRRAAVRLARVGRDDTVLDIACGTGDFARVFAAAGASRVVGCDFAHQMLVLAACGVRQRSSLRGRRRSSSSRPAELDANGRPASTLRWCEADALRLPFQDGSFSIAACAFGVRNFQDLAAGFSEMHRVLRPGGRVVILEFSRPANRLAGLAYEVYSTKIMPLAASWLSGDRSGAYRYLPRSVLSFYSAEQMCARLGQAGFTDATATPLTFGVVTVYVARRGR